MVLPAVAFAVYICLRAIGPLLRGLGFGRRRKGGSGGVVRAASSPSDLSGSPRPGVAGARSHNVPPVVSIVFLGMAVLLYVCGWSALRVAVASTLNHPGYRHRKRVRGVIRSRLGQIAFGLASIE